MEKQSGKVAMNFIYKTLLRGLIGILPLSLSVYVLLWFLRAFEGFIDNIVFRFFPFPQSIPGGGFVVGVFLVFLLGLLFSNKKFTNLFQMIQLPLKNIPLVKSVYSAIEDLMFYFSSSEGKEKGQVVVVTIPALGVRVIGLLTREEAQEIDPETFKDEKLVAVFVPFSYAIGGHTILVPEKNIQRTHLNVELAMKSAITAWMKKKENSPQIK